MANATLQSFNVFLTERLTAAAVDIYGFVEKTIIDYQEEVYQTKLENQRLQRLLDLVYKPEIRLHRADARQIDLPTPTQEVCVQEQQIQKKCIPNEANAEPVILPIKEELTDLWTRAGETPECSTYSNITDTLTQIIKVGEHEDNEMPGDLTQVVTVGEDGEYDAPDREHMEYEMLSQDDELSSSFGDLPVYTKKNNLFFCSICNQPFLRTFELKLHLSTHAATSLPDPTNKAFTCSLCGHATDTKSQMKSHMRTHGNKLFCCYICGNRYRLKGSMKEHLRTHTGERPYTCYVCGRGFNRSSTMSKHAMTKHRESMPFKCMQCGQRFCVLVQLKRHMRMTHDNTVPV